MRQGFLPLVSGAKVITGEVEDFLGFMGIFFSHVPLTCDEVEKDGDVADRVKLENAMTEVDNIILLGTVIDYVGPSLLFIYLSRRC